MVRRLDHAPFCVDLRAVGKATKPREMWLLRGTGLMDVLGCEPVHTESGHLVGFCAHHRVDPDDADPDTFLVSVTAVQSLVTRALAKAKGD